MTARVGKGFATLQQFGEAFIARLDAKLIDGDSARKVVEWIQGEEKALTEVEPLTLKRMIDRYRSGALRGKAIERVQALQKHKPLGFVAKHIHAMAQMEELALTQKARLHKMLQLEDGKPMLIGATSAEVRLYKEILVDLARMQLETGVMHRAPRTVTGVMVDAAGEVKSFTWTDEQDELLQGIIDHDLDLEADAEQ